MNQKDRINARGHAGGWHARQLEAECKRTGETMAARFWRNAANTGAFNVPAECVKVQGAGLGRRRVFYRFADGSELNLTEPARRW